MNNKSVALRVGIGFFCFLLLCYAAYQIYLRYYTSIETETAVIITIADTIETTGYTVRAETVITSEQSGVIVSKVQNGGKVSKGEAVANIFHSNEAANAYSRINEINRSLEEFESMRTAGEDASLVSSLQTQINDRLTRLSKAVGSGDLAAAQELRNELLYLINKRQIATKRVDGFDQRVAELIAEREALAAQYPEPPAQLVSPLSGYFIDEVDGYEGLLNSAMLDGLTPEGFAAIIAQHVETDTSYAVGKIADDYRWNIVCEVPSEQAAKLSAGSWYYLRLPFSKAGGVSALLRSAVQGEDTSRTLLVFVCTDTVSELSTVRSQPVTIEVHSAEGIGVRSSAIRVINKSVTVSNSDGTVTEGTVAQQGVYVVWGNEVKFRRIEEIYRVGDTVVCSVNSSSGWLKLYDEIIIEGKNLYDGKIINAS